MLLKILLKAVNFLLIAFFLVIFKVNLVFAESITGQTLKNYINSIILQHVQKQHPELATKNIHIFINNKDKFIRSLNYKSYRLAIKPKACLIGKHILPLNFYDQNGMYSSSLSIFVEVKAFQNIFKTNSLIKSGDLIKETVVSKELMNVLEIPKYAVYSIEEILNKEVKSSLAQGVIITSKMIRLRPDIRQGEAVNLIVIKNNIELMLKGIALEDGYIGNTFKITTDRFKKAIQGEVIDSKNVKVDIFY